MTRVSIYVIVVSALLVTGSAVNRYYTEITNLAWHVRHGFHAEIGGIRVRVPIAWEADDYDGLPSFWLTRRPGRLWQGGGFIDIDFRRLPSPEDEEAAYALLRKKGLVPPVPGEKTTRVGERTATFAGRQGRCVEYNIIETIPPIKGYEIECRFSGDVSVELIGSANLKNDFYDIIETAEPVKRKN